MLLISGRAEIQACFHSLSCQSDGFIIAQEICDSVEDLVLALKHQLDHDHEESLSLPDLSFSSSIGKGIQGGLRLLLGIWTLVHVHLSWIPPVEALSVSRESSDCPY